MTLQEFDEAKFIVETHRGIQANRTKREFHVLLTMLTFDVACVVARCSDKITVKNAPLFNWGVTVALVGIATAACILFHMSYQSTKVNQREIAQPAENLILTSLKISPPQQNPGNYIWLWQSVAVVIGGMIAVFVIWSQM